ncbi:hypothetical protein Mesil_3268 (plasmid) [Allomeiothermus silvanus DSM 9946]|uniref:PIN domain-containing protein n=1 Tax=Allomeiothermus silvanus (strain ATCC 700542 / DSM 9946 / NBRC 106475 / NCIMB 13440 / VI-R2) TaxID=526227 RepID=D7BIS7_ALLS1|nr:putative toxin-antitoxin system toxin component, PIN family [Allomeiothermus silvanus]ADH65083.1 hypothetical protein Mesil_3268 [Allomeiothermus silvanus DSM 9946]
MKLRLVLDTNVFVVALLEPSPEREILRAWRHGRFQLFTSRWQLKEIKQVSSSKLIQAYIAKSKFDVLLNRLKTHATVLQPVNVSHIVLADSDDDKIIAIALQAGAHILCTNDRHIIALKRLTGNTTTRILKPEATLKLL